MTVLIKSPEAETYEKMTQKANLQFKEHVLNQLDLFYLINESFNQIYTNYLNINEKAIIATTRLIRLLSVMIRNEQSMIDDLQMPIMVPITQNCSASLIKELELKPIVAATSKLYYQRDKIVDSLKLQLKKLEKKIKVELVEHNSQMGK